MKKLLSDKRDELCKEVQKPQKDKTADNPIYKSGYIHGVLDMYNFASSFCNGYMRIVKIEDLNAKKN